MMGRKSGDDEELSLWPVVAGMADGGLERGHPSDAIRVTHSGWLKPFWLKTEGVGGRIPDVRHFGAGTSGEGRRAGQYPSRGCLLGW